jgi:hypothetical protein
MQIVCPFESLSSSEFTACYIETSTKFAPAKINATVDLISDALPFGGLWYLQAADAVDYAKFRSRSHDAVIRVYDEAGKLIEMHQHGGDFKDW